MSITSKVFVDSSVLIEAIKGTRTELLERIVSDEQFTCYINDIVISEFMFHFLAVNTSVAPLTLKMQKNIPMVLQQNDGYKILQHFTFIDSDSQLIEFVPAFMARYNLLPNDAIILATCKIHRFTHIASYDSELIEPCENEKIQLLSA